MIIKEIRKKQTLTWNDAVSESNRRLVFTARTRTDLRIIPWGGLQIACVSGPQRARTRIGSGSPVAGFRSHRRVWNNATRNQTLKDTRIQVHTHTGTHTFTGIHPHFFLITKSKIRPALSRLQRTPDLGKTKLTNQQNLRKMILKNKLMLASWKLVLVFKELHKFDVKLETNLINLFFYSLIPWSWNHSDRSILLVFHLSTRK